MNANLEITPEQALGLENAFWLDVREPSEWAVCRLPGATLIPLGELENRLNPLPRDRPMVVYCHHGVRSLHAVRRLRKAGFADAVSLAGGIDRWSRERDASIPRY